jgi:hypothetical protein
VWVLAVLADGPPVRAPDPDGRDSQVAPILSTILLVRVQIAGIGPAVPHVVPEIASVGTEIPLVRIDCRRSYLARPTLDDMSRNGEEGR